MTDDYDVTTPEHLAWVKGLKVGDEVEWHGLNRWEHVVMGGPAHPLVAEFIRPTAAERQRMARLDAMGYPPPPNAVIAVAKLQTALDALQIAHDEWRDRALRAEALVQRMEAPSIRIPKVTPSATMKIGPAFHPITGAKFVHDGNGWHYEEKPDDDRGRGMLTMAAVSKGVGR